MSNTGTFDPKKYLLTPPASLYRLSGGIKLIVDSHEKCQVIGIKPGQEIHFSLNGRKIGATLFDYRNVRVFARSKCHDDDELNDPISYNLALRALGPDGKCLVYSQQLYWEGVSHVFHERRMYPEEGLVRRLVTQIRTCLRRFEKLFISYSIFLETFEKNPPLRGNCLKNKHTTNIGSEFGALLDSLYALRDAVNSIAYRLLFHENGIFNTKKFRMKILGSSKSGFVQLVSGAMFEEKDGDLILSRMSTYRSVALHCMGTSNPVVRDSIIFKEESGIFGPILRAVYPLYDDMAKLKAIELGTAIGFSFPRDTDEIKRFLSISCHQDALDFGFDCFERLLTIALLLGEELELESRLPVITDKDIISHEFTAR
jgi:hypothetical protein